MSVEEFPEYKDGDIVWVKLGSSWWPGEVTENGPEDFSAKKPPLAIVKFFNESTYEFVKNSNNIYKYNCERKNEFIKKGMDSFRANNAHMMKFPGDVSLAEIKTDGNPNILSDPIFAPQKKSNSSIIAEIFGTPTPKKKDGSRNSKGRPSSTKKNKKDTKVHITHRRFLGCDDYEAHIRIQFPGKDAEHLSGDEEIARLNTEPTQVFPCSSCSFTTTRLEVMLIHVQSHINGTHSPAPIKKKQSPKKVKKPQSFKHITSDDDRTNSSTGYIDTDSDAEVKPKPKRKKRSQGSNKKSSQKPTKNDEKLVTAEIRSNLLAEWSDSDDNDDSEKSKLDSSSETKKKSEKDDKTECQTKDLIKSCFDFEDEEEDSNVVHTAVGRKIPRVLPPTDKRKSTDPDNEDASLPLAEDDENRMEILKVNEVNENSDSLQNDNDISKEESVFKDLLDTTEVPELPEVPNLTKSNQNFPDGKSIKIPDKKIDTTEVATKLTNPKKRFVKSFEDFELLQSEQRKAQEEKDELKKEKDKLLESTESAIEKEESQPAQISDELITKDASKDSNEETESIVNEKVMVESVKPTSIKAVKQKEVEIEQIETDESVEETPQIAEISESSPKIEEEKIIEPISKIDSNLRISKLKCQIMSKLSDEESESSTPATTRSRAAHKTPRSKILETYRNNEQKTNKRLDENDQNTEVVSSNKKEKQMSKKSKYLKFNTEEMDSVEKIEEESTKEETIKPSTQNETVIEKTNSENDTGKVNQIDKYFNDFLFNIEKKSPKIEEETKLATAVSEINESIEEKSENEVHIKCAKNDESDGSTDISIKTNLTNFNKTEEMSALSTLAMVSELETNLDKKSEQTVDEKKDEKDDLKSAFEEHFMRKQETEMVAIDGNLTVVSEKDLADGQVEITANASPTCKKPVTLTNFSMDFGECNSNSNSDNIITESNEIKPEPVKHKVEENLVAATSQATKKTGLIEEMLDIEDQIPSQIVGKAQANVETSATPSGSKLLERLTTTDTKIKETSIPKAIKVPVSKFSTGKTKFVIKSGSTKLVKSSTQSSKPIILSEKIIKPEKGPSETGGSVSVQKITSKRSLQDPDEIDTFIIQKGAKKIQEDEDKEELAHFPSKRIKKSVTPFETKKLQQVTPSSQQAIKKRGKAKILQQTIISPAGEIIQPTVSQASTSVAVTDDNVFDINSMPIVLSDQILTPETIEKMPIFLSESVQQSPPQQQTLITTTTKVQPTIVKKVGTPSNQGQMRLLNKSVGSATAIIATPSDRTQKLIKTPKLLSSAGSKIIKHNSLPSGGNKHSKYVIVSQAASTTPTTTKFTPGKKQTFIKRSGSELLSTAGTLSKVQNISPEPSGNKIMILTNQQGQQQRVLLTPAQQKLMGMQNQGRVTKTLVKGNVLHKTKDGQLTPIPGSSGLISKGMSTTRITSNQTLISSTGQVLTPIHGHQGKSVRVDKTIPVGRKLQMQSQKVNIRPQQKTILIKNQHGETVRKIQGTDDALLDQQVAEQLEAIKASGVLQQKQEILNYKSAPKGFRRSYPKKIIETSPKSMVGKSATVTIGKADSGVPPLAPISPKKIDQPTVTAHAHEKVVGQQESKLSPTERPLNQLVIQDAMGNQTTITEGQILALPSETVDGQPQSYMLVTLDESGNLTPLNNEALLSLDPTLGLGGDLGNTVLQIDQNAIKGETTAQAEPATVSKPSEVTKTTNEVEVPTQSEIIQEQIIENQEKPSENVEVSQEQISDSSVLQSVNCNVGGEPSQQLIVTGDPIAAQKFLESLTEGSTDLANILASAEGSSILIHADGQQILINTDSENQMLLSVNTDNLNMTESTEGGGNPIFATQPSKNQDILAAALADTDVFQQEQNNLQSKVLQSQLSPNSALYPMNVGNVLETSLTLNSPIMTPLEVPSTNSKKISDENDILSQVPKNVDLPITITDPNISQTVAQQQVASLIANDLQSNLELTLPISDSVIAATTTEMNSPSFVYSLPNLDGSVDISQKPFNSSMPLLTEDSEEVTNESQGDKEEVLKSSTEEEMCDNKEVSKDKTEVDEKITSADGSFLDESEGLCTLGGEMCSSLSEPPPDMFDLSAVLSSHQMKTNTVSLSNKPIEETKSEEETDLKIDDKIGDESVSSESVNPDTASVTETSSPNTMNEDSCEIPVQPEIVTTLNDDGFDMMETGNKRLSLDNIENESKKCKFD